MRYGRTSHVPDRRRAPRIRPVGADAGSLPMAMLFILLAGTLSVLLVQVGLNHLVASRTTAERAHALHAAQAGIDVMAGRIRAATDADGNGVTSRLPGPELTGSVGADGTGRYRVAVTYHAADGTVVDVVGVSNPAVPSTAALVSTGVESASVDPQQGVPGTRTLQATYRFRTTNENIPGGMIPVNGDPTAADTLCLTATSPTPAAGSPVTTALCTQGDPAARRFAYTEDLALRLFGSEQVTPRGLCLQGAGDPTSPTYQHAVGQQIVLEPCAEVTDPHSKTLIAQQWSLRSYGTFYGTTDGTTVDGYCLNVQTPGSVGSNLILRTKSGGDCENGMYDDRWTLLPEATVGAGFAGAEQNWLGNGDPATARQLVSVGHEQFGRCLDIAGSYDPTKFDYLIAWPCKQSPDPSTRAWNQMWTLPAVDPGTKTGTGLIRSYVSDTARPEYYGKYLCLQSYGTTTQDPFVVECPAGTPPAALLWTVTADTGTYASSYRIEENVATGGRLCLTPAGPDPAPSELYQASNYAGPPISKVVLRACDGSQWQKWNAPPDLDDPSRITDFAER